MIKNYIALDLETTGLSAKEDKIIEIGAIKVIDGQEKDIFETLINPGRNISERITMVTGINDAMVAGAPYIEEIIKNLLDFAEELPLLGHNLMFDYSFVKRAAVNNRFEFERKGVDTLKLSRKYLSDLESKKLDSLCQYFGIEDEHHHRAINDARAAYKLYEILCDRYSAGDEEPVDLNYKVKREAPITPRQKLFLSDLVKKHNIPMDYDIDRLTKNEASRKIDIILSTFGRY